MSSYSFPFIALMNIQIYYNNTLPSTPITICPILIFIIAIPAPRLLISVPYTCLLIKQIIQFMKQGTPQAHPPLLQHCEIHLSALRPGVPLTLHPQCDCCHLPYNKQPFTLCFNQIQTLYLGAGVPLFFRFLVLCLIVALLPLCAYSIPTIVYKLQHQAVSSSFLFSISNLSSMAIFNQLYSYILAAVIAALLILVPILIKFSIRLLSLASSDQIQHFYPQALALMFELEKSAGSLTQEQAIKTLNDWCQVELKIRQKEIIQQVNIVEAIYFHFNLEAYTSMCHQMEQLQKQKEMRGQQEEEGFQPFDNAPYNTKNYNSRRSISSKYSYNSMKKKFSRLDEIHQKIRNKEIEKTNKFIVVFKTAQYLELVKQKVQARICNNHINKLVFPPDNCVKASDAPFPSEINYAAQHLSQNHRLKKRLLSWILTVVIIIGGSGSEYLTLFLFNRSGILDSMMLGPAATAGIFYIIGEIGLKLCVWLVSLQQQLDKSSQDCSSNIHTIVVGIFLRCFSILAVFYLAVGQLSSSASFVETVSWLVVIWPILMLLGRLVNLRAIRSCYVKSVAKRTIKQSKISQDEANRLFEKPSSQMKLQYAHFNVFLFSTFTFASIVPLSLLTCSIYFLLSLVVERIAFVYFQSQPLPTNHHLFLLMSNLLWKSTLGLTLGHYYFIFAFEQSGFSQSSEVKIIFSILLAIGCIVLLIPAGLFQTSTQPGLTYEKIKNKLVNTYDQFNNPYKIKFAVEAPKSAARLATKSEMLAEQLNTMSKSLETTLRDKIFNKKNPALEALNNREEDSLYFQFDEKVAMPPKKEARKSSVPPIFKQNREDLLFRRNSKAKAKNLIKLTHLVATEEETEIKNKIKTAIKDSINKIQ